jgi:hypothetical protein
MPNCPSFKFILFVQEEEDKSAKEEDGSNQDKEVWYLYNGVLPAASRCNLAHAFVV